jgi:ribosome biogenesis protein SSF1/2
MFPPIKV